MLKEFVKRVFREFGYELSRATHVKAEVPRYALYQYLKKDGSFDYEQYRSIQEEGNKKKLTRVWVQEENIEFLSQYIEKAVPNVQFGLCHGTRRGKEQEWFRKYLNCEATGTEISSTAENFPYTIQWDFHEVKPEWIGSVDFIYSNSFDHSYDPEKCLDGWISCLKTNGICIVEHSSRNAPDKIRALDPFGADLVLMPYLITLWGKGKYGVKEILPAPTKPDYVEYLNFIVIQKFKD